jgi:hypothetical protein
MKRGRFLSRIALCAALFLTSTALDCGTAFCWLVVCEKPDNVLDGSWPLTTVNNRPFSSFRPGYQLPGENQYIQTGRLTFGTQEWDDDKHSGNVRAIYSSVTLAGGAKPNDEYNGTFEYYPKTGKLTLRMALRSREVQVAGTTIIASGVIPPFESATITFTKQ